MGRHDRENFIVSIGSLVWIQLPEWLCPSTIRLQVCRVFFLMQSPGSTMLFEATRNTIDPWRNLQSFKCLFICLFGLYDSILQFYADAVYVLSISTYNKTWWRCHYKHDTGMLYKRGIDIICVNSLNNISVDQLVWLPLHVIGHCRVMSRLCFSKSWVRLNLLLDAFCCCCSRMRVGHVLCS